MTKKEVFKGNAISGFEAEKSELLMGEACGGLRKAKNRPKVRFKIALEMVLEDLERAKIG